jgi:hypothetical protein
VDCALEKPKTKKNAAEKSRALPEFGERTTRHTNVPPKRA